MFQQEGAKANFNTCHDIESKILKRFVVFRLKVHCDFVSQAGKQKRTAPAATGSSTAGGKAYVDNPASGKRKGGWTKGPVEKK
jgi:hypothetical protein